MTLAEVQGQHKAVEALSSALRKDAVHHAWLFAGPEGVGKELTAQAFAQALTCQVKPKVGCGECPSCGRILRRNHPDVHWLMAEEEQVARGFAGRSDFTGTPSREIRVEQVRALQDRLAFRALESDRKVAIVASAEKMNVAAQNAFLKTLEEPPSGTVIVLVAASPDRLLPTIRSRCSRAQFGPLPAAFITAQVARARKLDEDTAHLVAQMASGSLSRALQMDVEGLSRRKEIIAQFEGVSFSDAGTLIAFAEVFGSSRDAAVDALGILSLWTRDVAVAKVGADSIANRDLLTLARSAAKKVSDAELQRRHRLLDEAREAIAHRNGQPRLQLERMLIEMGRAAGALR